MDTLVKWLIIIALLIAVPMLQNSIYQLEKRQGNAWTISQAERNELLLAIMEINGKLRVMPDQVLEQVKAMRQEHHEMRQLINPEAREAWHREQHLKPTKVGTR
jgi:hypothetical protein